MKKYKNKSMYLALAVIIFLIGIGYAVLTTNLSITGTSGIANATWDVHFENPNPTGKSNVTPSVLPAADPNDKVQSISYTVTFNEPGDVYEFTVDVANRGSIDAMINGITSTYQIGDATPVDLTQNNPPEYLNYYVKYSDGIGIENKQKLVHGTTEELVVHVEFKRDINNTQFSQAIGNNITFTYGLNYIQTDGTETVIPHPSSFANDSWDTIITAAQNNHTSAYTVGSTRDVTLSIDLDNDGEPENHTYTLRVANNSTPAECSTTGFSQTACGFVLEFADVITTHRMNPIDDSGNSNGDGNKGGWKYSELRTYVNSDIYNALPSTLKNAVINTNVVSGHGSNDSANFTTTDKLYLLSTKEVWGKEDTTNVISWDTAEAETRQLDYYKNNNITTASCSNAIKQYNSSNYYWWLRTAISANASDSFVVNDIGGWGNSVPTNPGGVSPAFRLGPSE